MSDNLNIKYCNGCGEKIIYDAKFCKKCGFKQIRIAKEMDYSINDDSKFKIEKNIQTAETKSNNEIILLSGLVIVCLLSFLFFQYKKPNEKLLVAAADSVSVDTSSAYYENVPVDTTSSIVVTNDSVPVAIESNNGYNIENNLSAEEDNIGRKLLVRFSQLNIEGNYENFEEIFGDKIEFHNLKYATMAQVKADIINYKRKWSIVSENLISLDLVSNQKNYNRYHYEKEIQLKRNPDDGNLYNYKISGQMIIDNEIGKIMSLKDQKTTKVN